MFSAEEKHLQECCIAVLIHIFNTGFHVFILLSFIFFGLLQVIGGLQNFAVKDFYLHFGRRNLFTQVENILIDPLQFIFKGRGLVFPDFLSHHSPRWREGWKNDRERTEQGKPGPDSSFFVEFHNLKSFLKTVDRLTKSQASVFLGLSAYYYTINCVIRQTHDKINYNFLRITAAVDKAFYGGKPDRHDCMQDNSFFCGRAGAACNKEYV